MAQRTLDEYLQDESAMRQRLADAVTTLPPTATLSTPMGSMLPSGTAPMAALMLSRAMPVLPPPNPFAMLPAYTAHQMAMGMQTPGMGSFNMPMLGTSPGVTGAFAPSTLSQQSLMATAGFLNPGNALANMQNQWGARVGAVGANIGGFAGSFAPGGLLGSLAGGWAGGVVGGALANNPLTRGVYGMLHGGVAQDLSMMANLQHRTAASLQMAGGAVGVGGTGMSAGAAFGLGQRFTGIAETWAQRENYGRGLFDKVGSADIGRYKRDLVQMTEMAGNIGLLDTASNIDQVVDTVQKLMKVMGRMAKITGDPDFRNNLREIGNLRAMGLSIEQAVETTRGLAFYAKGAGVTRQQLMSQGGMMGAQMFGQMGMAGGVGVLYGGAAQAQARQLMGAFSPIQEQLLGGREGIAQHIAGGAARFAAGPAMNAMMGAALTLGADNTLTLDPARLAETLRGGTSFSGLAGRATVGINQIARQMAQQTGRRQTDVMAEILNRLPELQSELAQRLGPEGMSNLQLSAVASLGKTMGLRTAANVVGGSQEQANILMAQATDPAFLSRRRAQLMEELREASASARNAAAEMRERRREERDTQYWHENLPGLGAYRRARQGLREFGERWRHTEGEEHLRDIREQEDALSGQRRVYFGRGLNEQVMREMESARRLDPRTAGEFDMRAGGLDRFSRMRADWRERQRGGYANISSETLEAVQQAQGRFESVFQAPGRWAENIGAGIGRFEYGAARIFGGVPGFASVDQLNAANRGRLAEVAQIADRALEAASAIEKTRDSTISDWGRQVTRLKGALGKRGIPQEAAATIRNRIVTYATQIGKQGGALNMAQMRTIAAKALMEHNASLTEAEAQRIVADNADAFNKYNIMSVRSFGGADALRAVAETTDVAQRLEAMDTKKLQQSIDDQQQNQRKIWYETGVAGARPFGALGSYQISKAEEMALGEITREGSTAEGAAMEAIWAMSQGGKGISDEQRQTAVNEIARIAESGTAKEKALLEKVQGRLAEIRTQGADTAVLGRFAREHLRTTGSLTFKGLSEGLALGRQGKGQYAGTFYKEAASLELRRRGAQVGGDAATLAGAAVGPEGERVRSLEKQIGDLGDLQRTFSDFGDATKDFKIAAQNLKEITQEKLTTAKSFFELITHG